MAAMISSILPTARGSEVSLESKLKNSLTYRKLRSANQFEDEEVDSDDALQTVSSFHTGAPPAWPNFYLPERAGLQGIPFSCKECDHIKDASRWIKVAPLVSIESGITIHRHVTKKGHFECKVSGLRWVCASDVKLRYYFSNWEPHCAFLGTMQYIQGGPLLELTMELGELEEVHLPHFGCLGNDDPFKDGVRILHVEKSGMSVEKVHEVTRFHAKLLRPTFSAKGVLLRSGFPLKIHCDLMVYLSKSAHLNMRIYLIPSDPDQVKAVEKKERSYGFSWKSLPVPRPERSLKLKSWLKLKTSCPAKIEPDEIQLRYSNTTPSFFKVLMEDCDDDFNLELICANVKVWQTGIYKAEVSDLFPSRTQAPPVILPAGFVKSHRAKLIQSTKNVLPIVEVLLSQSMIHEEEYSRIKATTVPQDQMRILLDSVIPKGQKVETAFVKAMRDECPSLFEQLVTNSGHQSLWTSDHDICQKFLDMSF